MAWSEPAVPQPVGKFVAIARTTSRRLQHFSLHVIGNLRGFEALRHPPEPLSRAAAGEEQQKDGRDQGGDAEGGAAEPPRTEPGKRAGYHRRPRFHVWTAPAAQVVC